MSKLSFQCLEPFIVAGFVVRNPATDSRFAHRYRCKNILQNLKIEFEFNQKYKVRSLVTPSVIDDAVIRTTCAFIVTVSVNFGR